MTEKPKIRTVEKDGLHPRNKHRNRYDFELLIQRCPSLAPYVSLNKYKDLSIDFSNPVAVKQLNKALLGSFYGVDNWDIPAGFLCPPVPGRADYIHYIADLLAECNAGVIPLGRQVMALDIGIGANCIYPIIGTCEYGWQFTGADIDPLAIRSARHIITANTGLADVIEVRHQPNKSNIYQGISKPGELFDVSICNPPFHSSMREAELGTQRKLKNLGNSTSKKTALNFGGQSTELWCPGGELAFVNRMIAESAAMPTQCLWYSTLVSKKDNLAVIYRNLQHAGSVDVKTINMAQGQKVSRIVAWTFLNTEQRQEWSLKRWR